MQDVVIIDIYIIWFDFILTHLFSVLHFYNPWKPYKDNPEYKNVTLETNGTKYSRLDQVKFVEDSL